MLESYKGINMQNKRLYIKNGRNCEDENYYTTIIGYLEDTYIHEY